MMSKARYQTSGELPAKDRDADVFLQHERQAGQQGRRRARPT